MTGKRTLLIAIALVSIVATASAEIKVVKDFRYPFLRSFILNPKSLPNHCVMREFRVLHRRDAEGRPYDLEIAPIGEAETELIPSVIEAFYRWRFKVPVKEDWRAEFLSMSHENIFRTVPPCDCNDSCNTENLD